MTNLRSFVLAALALTFCAVPGLASAAPVCELRARGADAHGLIRLLARLDRKNTVIGPGVTGAVRLDVTKDSLHGLEGEVVRASGADFVILGGNFVLVDVPVRIEAAKVHPVRRLLDGDEYEARRVSLDFVQIRLVRLLHILEDVTKRPFEVAEGVDARVTVIAKNVPWNKLLDVLVVAGDLSRTPVERSIRVARRADRTPRFSPVQDLDDVAAGGATETSPSNRCRTRLGGSKLIELKLVAVVTGIEDPVSLVRLPDGSEHEVRRGTCVGAGGGVAMRVERDRVVVQEIEVRDDGSGEPVERVLALDAE
jgi:Tfp pilus assembly protein PilP